MGTSFTNTFGGSPVSPADVSYSSISMTSSTQFYWPAFAAGNPNVISRFMNVQVGTPNLNMQMPDASLVSVGTDLIIQNSGTTSFNVVDYLGGAIATIVPGTAWYVQVIGNTTQNGSWSVLQFGAGSSNAQASQLAGAGLAAVAGLLNLDLNASYVSADFSVSSSSLSILYVWDGGSGTAQLPLAASVGNGFFFMVANNGSGAFSVATTNPDLIDNASSSVFNPGQSAFIMSTGSSWSTVGKGTQSTYIYSLNNLNVAGNSDVTLTSVQAQSVFQTYTGVLTGNINVIVPATVQLYVVANQTSGAFGLTIKTPLGTGIAVPQGQTSILYCDGTNVLSAFSFVPSGSQSLPAGSATAPSLNYASQTNTGIYFNSSFVGITGTGTEIAQFTAPSLAVNYFAMAASIAGSPVSISALGTDGNIGFSFVPKGTGASVFGGTTGVVVPSGTTAQRVVGAGTIRYNTDAPQLEAYVNGAWTTLLLGTNNLSDVLSPSTARTNLGLGTAALATSGTTGHTLGFLDGTNTWSGSQNYVGAVLNVATQSASNSTTLAASTAMVQAAIAALGTASTASTGTSGHVLGFLDGANTWSGTQNFTGSTTTVATQLGSDSTTKAASTAQVHAALALAIALANGSTATTQSVGDNSTNVATTAYADNAGKLILLGSTTASNSSTISFTGLSGALYSEYILEFDSVLPVSNANSMQVRVSTGSGFISSSSYAYQILRYGISTSAASGSSADNDWVINSTSEPLNSASPFSGKINIYGADSTSTIRNANWAYYHLSSNSALISAHAGGQVTTQAAVIDGVSIFLGSGNISSGKFRLYGVRNS